MTRIEIYTKPDCIYCVKAKWHINTFLSGMSCIEKVLTSANKEFIETKYNVKVTRVPQIIVGGDYVGGFDELVEYIDGLL